MNFLFNFAIVVFSILFLASCSPTRTFYQVYQVSPSIKDKMTISEDSLFFEDENCKLTYDFWTEGGNVGFKFYNKTDKDIILNLERSFFILNGIAYNYYKDRTYSTLENLITYSEEKKVSIPSKTAKIINEYNVSQSLYRDCDLYKYPRRKQIKTKSFKESTSPYVFSNRISYTSDSSLNEINLSNEFFVSAITNYPQNEVIKNDYLEFCDQKSFKLTPFFKDSAVNKFFIKYNNALDRWKH